MGKQITRERKRVLRRANCLVARLEADGRFWFLVAQVQLSRIQGETIRRGVG